jgi:hypothetical protein
MHARRYALPLFALVLASPVLALAQDGGASGGGLDFETLSALASIFVGALVGAYFVGAKLIDRMAARPQVDGWDDAKAKLEAITPYVEKIKAWADPENPSVPPSPGNPAGVSR